MEVVSIYNHVDSEQFYKSCDYCKNDILYGDKITVLQDMFKRINLHNKCEEPYITERFNKRVLIAGVSDE